MEIKIEGDKLHLTIPINKPLVPSKSGKSILVASSGGNKPTAAIIDGKNVTIGLNCYIAAD